MIRTLTGAESGMIQRLGRCTGMPQPYLLKELTIMLNPPDLLEYVDSVMTFDTLAKQMIAYAIGRPVYTSGSHLAAYQKQLNPELEVRFFIRNGLAKLSLIHKDNYAGERTERGIRKAFGVPSFIIAERVRMNGVTVTRYAWILKTSKVLYELHN